MVGSTSHTTLLAYVFRSLSPAFCSRKMVGSSGLEPPTSRLSGVCSNQLSYTPMPDLYIFEVSFSYSFKLLNEPSKLNNDILNSDLSLSTH